MRELDIKVFYDVCKEKSGNEETQIKASKLCTLWQDNLKDIGWHPMKVVIVEDEPKEIIDENDEMLKNLKGEWGTGIYDAKVAAFEELNEHR
ncbi:XH/XS domain-containing protein [Tanacetum coccineum]